MKASLLCALFAWTLWSVFKGEDFDTVISFLKTAQLRYVLPGVGCVVLFIGGEAMIIHYLLRVLGSRIKIWHCWIFSFIGFFYSCITPSASGGQPMQVLAIRRDDIPPAVSTVVLAIIAITYKLVLVLIGAVVLIVRPAKVMVHIGKVIGLIYVGMALNVICIIALLMLVFRPMLVKSMAGWVMRLVERIRPFKHPEKVWNKLDHIAAQYAGTADFYRNNKRVLVNVFIITFVQRCMLFAITYFTYLAFGLMQERPATIMTLQSMISVAVDMLPFPGGMGISENMFIDIFQAVFGEDRVLPAMVISRGISFYTQVLLSGIMTVASVFLIRDRRNAY